MSTRGVPLALLHVLVGLTLAGIAGAVLLLCLGTFSSGLPDLLAGIASGMLVMGVGTVLVSAAVACALGGFEPYWRSTYALLAALTLLAAGLLKAIPDSDALWCLGLAAVLGYLAAAGMPRRRHRLVPSVVLILAVPAFCLPASWCPAILGSTVIGICAGGLIRLILSHRLRRCRI